jgi:DNA-binding NarL/FixJ family response regulator
MKDHSTPPPTPSAWGVMIVEDDPDMAAYLSECIGKCPRLRLIGLASTVGDSLRRLREVNFSPDVLLVDLGLPDGSGIEVLRAVNLSHPQCESLVLSMFGDHVRVLESIEAGALGYIHKDALPEDITQTILEMKAGGSPISPMIARLVLSKYRLQSEPDGVHPSTIIEPSTPHLSLREQEVLTLMSKGFSYVEIARLQGVTVNTVRSHIKNLYEKLSVHSRTEAVFEAKNLGLL